MIENETLSRVVALHEELPQVVRPRSTRQALQLPLSRPLGSDLRVRHVDARDLGGLLRTTEGQHCVVLDDHVDLGARLGRSVDHFKAAVLEMQVCVMH